MQEVKYVCVALLGALSFLGIHLLRMSNNTLCTPGDELSHYGKYVGTTAAVYDGTYVCSADGHRWVFKGYIGGIRGVSPAPFNLPVPSELPWWAR